MSEKNRLINIYNTRVKVTGWNSDESHPRDYDPYNVCKKNYFLSTHKRLGSDDGKLPISTTQEMLQEVLSLDKRSRQKQSFQGSSFPLKERCKFMLREGQGVHPIGYLTTDYITTSSNDFRHPNPHCAKPATKIDLSIPTPPSIYRRLRYDIKKQNEKFMDWNVQKQPHADYLKITPPPYVNLDLYYGIDRNKEVKEENQCPPCECNDDGNKTTEDDVKSNEENNSVETSK